MESIARWRAPAAYVALITLLLQSGLRIGSFARYTAADAGSVREVASALSPGASTQLLIVVLGLLVAASVLWRPIASAGLLAWSAVVITGLATLGAVVAVAAVVGRPEWSEVGVLLPVVTGLVVPLLVLTELIALARVRTDPVAVEATPPAVLEPVPETPALSAAEQAAAAEREPTWAVDEAAGAVWRTAGEAAQGAPASDWGSGTRPGWSGAVRPPGPSAAPDDEDDHPTAVR